MRNHLKLTMQRGYDLLHDGGRRGRNSKDIMLQGGVNGARNMSRPHDARILCVPARDDDND